MALCLRFLRTSISTNYTLLVGFASGRLSFVLERYTLALGWDVVGTTVAPEASLVPEMVGGCNGTVGANV